MSNVIDLRSVFECRHCAPGSSATHEIFGEVTVLRARGLEREIRYTFERVVSAKSEIAQAHADTTEYGSAWVQVSTLQQHSPIDDLYQVPTMDQCAVLHVLERLSVSE